MNTKKNFVFLILGLLMTFLLPNSAMALVWKDTSAQPVPATAMSGSKVTICHGTSSATNPYVKITISLNGLNGHDGHTGSGNKKEDFFYNYSTNKCEGGVSPTVCSSNQYWVEGQGNRAGSCTACPTGQVADDTGEACIAAPTPPTISCAPTTDHVAGICRGNVGTSTALTITIATTNVSGASITPVVANGTWTYTAPILAAGTYSVTVNGTNGVAPQTGTLVVTASLPPVVTQPPPTTDSVPVDIHGTFGTSTTISSVTLTKSGTNAVTTLGAVSLDPPTVNGWKVSSGVVTVGTYTIKATDAKGLISNLATLTVECAGSKTANFASDGCISAPTVTASQTFATTTPAIKGTVGSSDAMGNPALGTVEAFKVVVNGVTYTYRTDAALSVTGTAWTLTIPTANALTAGQSYPVVATRDGTLSGNGTITINGAPSVDVHPDTYDTTPILTGTIGTTALGSDTFSVKINNQTYPYTAGITTDGHVIVNADLTWRLTISTANKLPAGTYPIEAIRNTLTGAGSIIIKPCALPNVVDEVADTCSLPVPTVVQANWDSNTTAARIITGTIGTAAALGSDEAFSVTIGTTPVLVYSKPNAALNIANTGAWTLTIPTAAEILAGTYSVEAARNTTAKDATSGELIVNLVCLSTETAVNGACVSTVSLPTVVSFSTDDTTPTITVTTGGGGLVAGETFTVDVNGQTYSPTPSGTEWSVTIPIEHKLNAGSYTVEAKRVELTGTGIVTITQCASPKVVNATTGDCSLENPVPTVTPLKNTPDKKPTLSGTIGTTPLTNNETFIVTVSGATYTNGDGHLSVSGTDWTLLITTELKPGTYDVDAVRQGTHDKTSGELVINDDIEVCIRPTTTGFISRSAFDSAKHDLGKCVALECTDSPTNTIPNGCTPPKPKSPEDLKQNLPDEPLPLANQYVDIIPPEIIYCDDGGVKSSIPATSPATGVTIKRAKIVNASTRDGTIDLSNVTLKYGEKVVGTGTMDISSASIDRGQAKGVTLTGVTLNKVFIDTASDYIDSDGHLVSGNTSFIPVTGGTTLPTTTKEDGSITRATIFSGMITSGTDSNGNPIRGSATSGGYETEILNSPSVITQGRRTRGTLKNATITNARTTTFNGETIVDKGTITSGTMDSGALTFGTVTNATLTNATISTSNTCFSSGTVGSRGQLNWKEVVK